MHTYPLMILLLCEVAVDPVQDVQPTIRPAEYENVQLVKLPSLSDNLYTLMIRKAEAAQQGSIAVDRPTISKPCHF